MDYDSYLVLHNKNIFLIMEEINVRSFFEQVRRKDWQGNQKGADLVGELGSACKSNGVFKKARLAG